MPKIVESSIEQEVKTPIKWEPHYHLGAILYFTDLKDKNHILIFSKTQRQKGWVEVKDGEIINTAIPGNEICYNKPLAKVS